MRRLQGKTRGSSRAGCLPTCPKHSDLHDDRGQGTVKSVQLMTKPPKTFRAWFGSPPGYLGTVP